MLKEKVSDLRGIVVVDYEKGEQVGKVRDIFIDRRDHQIMGISYVSGRLSGGDPTYVEIDNIYKIGKDVVIVADRDLAAKVSPDLERSSLKALVGLPVISVEGEKLGELVDLNVDADRGTIQEIILAGDKSIEIEADAVELGRDAIIVPGAYATRVQRVERQENGILGRLIRSARVSESLKETSQQVGQRVVTTAEKMGEIMKQSWDRGRSRHAEKEPKVQGEDKTEQDESGRHS